jgi:PKHD-type hydroxylase
MAFRNGVARDRSYQGIVDKALRECQFVEAPQPLIRDLETCLLPVVQGDFELSGARFNPPVVIYRYPPGVGFTPHHDRVTAIELARARDNGQPVLGGEFTAVLFLSDPEEYGGGELYFPDHMLAFKPASGSLVAFPATEEFVHGVAPVTWGERLTTVARIDVGRH